MGIMVGIAIAALAVALVEIVARDLVRTGILAWKRGRIPISAGVYEFVQYFKDGEAAGYPRTIVYFTGRAHCILDGIVPIRHPPGTKIKIFLRNGKYRVRAAKD